MSEIEVDALVNQYRQLTQPFETLLDFFRFGVSLSRQKSLYFGHGTDNAWDDMLALVLGSLHLPYDSDAFVLQARVTAEEKCLLASHLAQRIERRIPVPYLTHEALFCDLSFYVDERVLIPRSPLAELIKRQFSPWVEPTQVQRVLDLCTGSGCIAIACSAAFPEASIDAVDISLDALAVASINREKYGLEARVSLIDSDCYRGLPETARYEVIVSNPPYVGHAEMQDLPSEYTHEPRIALEAGNQGLAVIERIVFSAQKHLSAHGILVVEVGNSEALLVEKYPDVPFTWLEFEHGGQGVFLLTAEQVNAYGSLFNTGAL